MPTSATSNGGGAASMMSKNEAYKQFLDFKNRIVVIPGDGGNK